MFFFLIKSPFLLLFFQASAILCKNLRKSRGIKHKQSGDGWNGPLGTIASHTIKLIRENIERNVFSARKVVTRAVAFPNKVVFRLGKCAREVSVRLDLPET